MPARVQYPSVIVSVMLSLMAGCTGGQELRSHLGPNTDGVGGSADRGKVTMETYECGKCHTVPGIRNANGVVGPPLAWLARRTYIAGNFANTPDNLVHWVMDPPSIKPRTAMPRLGLTEPQARDVAAYLYTLK